MSLASLEYRRQAREERDYDLAISLPGAGFSLWILPIFTHRRGPTEFTTNGWELISIENERGSIVGFEFRDGCMIGFVGGPPCSFYWPAERFERHNLGGRLSS